MRQWLAVMLFGSLGWGAALAQEADPGGPRVFQRQVVVLRVQPLTATLLGDPSRAEFAVDPRDGTERSLSLGWPEAQDRCTLRLRVEERRSPAPERRRVNVRAELVLPDETRVRSQRDFDIEERATTLFEVYRLGDRSLTLALEGRVEMQMVLPGRQTIGAPVLLEVEVQRVIAGRVIPLERNGLNTFIGEPVTYSFDLGPPGVAESASLTLLPQRVSGEVLEIEVTITGSLPSEGGPQMVSRTEQWYASRNAATSAAFETGDPPTGYRFKVTPRF